MYPQGRRDVIKVATAGVIGTTIEWYDFNIAATASTLVWPSIFFPSSNPASGIILSLLTLSAGFISRPVGAILFGHFGDKVGEENYVNMDSPYNGFGHPWNGVSTAL